MKSITRNKLLIEGWPADQMVEIGLQQHCKDHTCIVIWPRAIHLFPEAILAVLSEKQTTQRCETCQQVVREGMGDDGFDALIHGLQNERFGYDHDPSDIIIVFCEHLEQATHIHQNLMAEQKKIGDVGECKSGSRAQNQHFRMFEVWSDGKQVLPEKTPDKQEAEK